MSQESRESDEILFASEGRLGRITLNRPQALNALTFGMLEALEAHYKIWAQEPEIYGVVLEAAGERAFCAGADVKAVYHIGRVDPVEAANFFRREYEINWALECFNKPHVALIDGMVMGGGVGITRYGTHRVVSEKASLAMPETGIGLFPDVGASWFLTRLPGAMGLYLGLTGQRVGAADMVALGLATHHIKARDFAAISTAIAQSDPIDPVLDDLHHDPEPCKLAALQEVIDQVFSAPDMEQIMARLAAVEGAHESWARTTREDLLQRSPLSLKATFTLLTKHRPKNLKQALENEFRLVTHMLQGPDFYEGVRAQLIDKDRRPKWQHGTLADVSDSEVAALFAPPSQGELVLPVPDDITGAPPVL